MRVFAIRSSTLSALAALFLLALPASAAPILSATPTSIALSPTQTVITFSIDPNGTPMSGFQLNLSALASGLVIAGIQSLDADVTPSGPALVGSDYQAGFIGLFLADRSTPFTFGTVTVEGLVAGTALVGEGSFFDSLVLPIDFGPSDLATVVAAPEPSTAALVSVGLVGLLAARRRRV